MAAKQQSDVELWERHCESLNNASDETVITSELKRRRDVAAAKLAEVKSAEYLKSLVGTSGRDPAVSKHLGSVGVAAAATA